MKYVIIILLHFINIEQANAMYGWRPETIYIAMGECQMNMDAVKIREDVSIYFEKINPLRVRDTHGNIVANFAEKISDFDDDTLKMVYCGCMVHLLSKKCQDGNYFEMQALEKPINVWKMKENDIPYQLRNDNDFGISYFLINHARKNCLEDKRY